MQLLYILISTAFGASGQIALKKGMTTLKTVIGFKELLQLRAITKMFTNYYVLLGILLYGISSIIWLGLLSQLEVSFLYPLVSLSYLITTFFAIVVLKEKVPPQRWIGTLIIVLGSSLIVLS